MSQNEAQLLKEGWQKKNTIDEPRLSECVEMYEELGFEVRLVEPTLDDMPCSECFKRNINNFKTIYVRKEVD